MAFLKQDEVITGREGQVIATINGQVRELAEIRKLEAKITKNKTAFRVLGWRGTYNKTTGFEGTGSMTIYYNTTVWAQIMRNYTANGVDTLFDVVVMNEDPTSAIGRQRIRLNSVSLNELVVAKVDADAEFLDTEVAFTFNDYDILNSFNRG